MKESPLDIDSLSIEDCLIQCIQSANPLSEVSPYQRKYFETDIRKTLPRTDPYMIKKVMLWAVKQEKYRQTFTEPNPHHAFANNWNRISADFMNATSKPPLTTSPDTESWRMSDAEYQSVISWYKNPVNKWTEEIPSKKRLEEGRRKVDESDPMGPELRASIRTQERLKAIEKEKERNEESGETKDNQ